jgi:hypothetical protein
MAGLSRRRVGQLIVLTVFVLVGIVAGLTWARSVTARDETTRASQRFQAEDSIDRAADDASKGPRTR